MVVTLIIITMMVIFMTISNLIIKVKMTLMRFPSSMKNSNNIGVYDHHTAMPESSPALTKSSVVLGCVLCVSTMFLRSLFV